MLDLQPKLRNGQHLHTEEGSCCLKSLRYERYYVLFNILANQVSSSMSSSAFNNPLIDAIKKAKSEEVGSRST